MIMKRKKEKFKKREKKKVNFKRKKKKSKKKETVQWSSVQCEGCSKEKKIECKLKNQVE